MYEWLLLNKYKIIFFSAIIGIYFSPFFKITFNPIWMIFLLFVSIFIGNNKRIELYRFLFLFLFIFTFLINGSNRSWQRNLKLETEIKKIFDLNGKNFYRLNGKIEKIEKFGRKFDTYLFEVSEIELNGRKLKVSIPSFLKIRKKKIEEFYLEGDLISLIGKVKDWKGLKNENQIGKFFYFASKKRFVEIYSKPEFIEVLRKAKKSIRMKYFSFILRKFKKNRNLDILIALLFGIKSANFSTYQTFSEAGLYHLLVISGFHIGLIMFLLFLPLKFFFRKKYSLLISLFIITIYILFINLSPATLRAYSMVLLFTILFLMDRKISLSEIVSLSGIILLFFNPFYIFHVGFLLSFISLYAIIFIFIPINEKFILPVYDASKFIYSESFDVSSSFRSERGRKIRFFMEKVNFYFFPFIHKNNFRFFSKILLYILFNVSGLFLLSFSINFVLFLFSGYFNILIQPLSLFSSIISTYLVAIILFFLIFSIPLFFIFSKISFLFVKLSLLFIDYLSNLAFKWKATPLFLGKIPFLFILFLILSGIFLSKRCKKVTFFIIILSIISILLIRVNLKEDYGLNVTVLDCGKNIPIMLSLKKRNILINFWDMRNLIYIDEVLLPYLREKNMKNVSLLIPKRKRSYFWPLRKLYFYGILNGVYILGNGKKLLNKKMEINFKVLEKGRFLFVGYKRSKFLIYLGGNGRNVDVKGLYNFIVGNTQLLRKVKIKNTSIFLIKGSNFKDLNGVKILDISRLGEMEFLLNGDGINKVYFPYLEKLEYYKIILNRFRKY